MGRGLLLFAFQVGQRLLDAEPVWHAAVSPAAATCRVGLLDETESRETAKPRSPRRFARLLGHLCEHPAAGKVTWLAFPC